MAEQLDPIDRIQINSVFVCQGRTCKKQGAIAVLAAFHELNLPDWTIQSLPCRGLCGNGPMVGVLPANVWYRHVRVEDVPIIAKQHLLGGQPVERMMYPPTHS